MCYEEKYDQFNCECYPGLSLVKENKKPFFKTKIVLKKGQIIEILLKVLLRPDFLRL